MLLLQNDITRLKEPFSSRCMESWEDTKYEVTTSMKYSLAVSDDG